MVISSNIIVIPWGESHQIQNILPLVTAQYTLYLNTPSNPLLLSFFISKLNVAVNIQLITHHLHQGLKLLIIRYSLSIVNRTILATL